MAITPVYSLPYQVLTDPPHGPNLGEQLATHVETELSRIDAAAVAVGRLGVVGGKRWTTGGALANGVGASEGGTNIDTGVVTLVPGRSYSFAVKLSCGFTDASANFFDFRVRKGSVTGAQVGDHVHSDNQSTFGRDVEFNVDVPDIGAAAITDTYYLTVQRLGGTGVANISRGTTANATYFYLVDKGPISRITAA